MLNSHLILVLQHTAPVYFHLNSSQKYACLGEAYKMTCTSTGAFDKCGLSYPSWYKDGELVRCHNCTFNTGNTTDVLYAPINDENARVYYCAVPDNYRTRPPPQCQSNNFTVQPLSKPECTHCLDHMEVLACCQCTVGVACLCDLYAVLYCIIYDLQVGHFAL